MIVGTPGSNTICFGAMALLMAFLTVMDYRSEGRKDVFLPAMLIMAVPQFLFLANWDSPAWRSFAAWFAGLPLT